MRIGAPGGAGFGGQLAGSAAAAQEAFGAAVAALTEHSPARVMNADGTVSEQQTFDPGRFRGYLAAVSAGLEGWDVRESSSGEGGGLRREFSKISASAGGYSLSAHMCLQYHALLHYRPDWRAVECRRELEGLAAAAEASGRASAAAADAAAAGALEAAGRGGLGPQELFEALYRDEGLLEGAGAAADAAAGSPEAPRRRDELLAELDGMLVETYQTTAAMLDEARLATGEEGAMLAIDLEPEGGGRPDLGAVPAAARAGLLGRLGGLAEALRAASPAP